MIVDSHVHLHLINYKAINSNLDNIIQSAIDNNVNTQLCVATHINQYNDILSTTYCTCLN